MNLRPTAGSMLGVAALAAILAGGVLLATREPASTKSSRTDAAIASVATPSPAPVTGPDETAPADEDLIPGFPERLARIVAQIRAQGDSIWWAEAIEIAFTRGIAAAADHLRQFVPAEELDEKTANLVTLIGQEKLEGLAESLALIHATNLRSGAVSSIISTWARKDPLKLAKYAHEHFSGEQKNRALTAVIEALAASARFDDARSVLKQMPASEARARTIGVLAQRWGKQDLAAAFAWARQLTAPAERLGAERALIGMARENASLERLRELAALYGTEENRTTWDSVIGEKLVATDLAAATEWAETLPPASGERLRQRIAAKVAESDLAQGTALALKIKGDSARTSTIDQIHRELWERDMQATTSWVWTLPDEFQHRVVVGMVTRWFRADEAGAVAWVKSLPGSLVRDRAAMWLAWELERTRPGAGAELASTIADAKLRTTAFDELQRNAR